MNTTVTLKVGDRAPDFKLDDQNWKSVRLSKLRGRRVLLSFHPLAWTPVCSKQMKSLEAHAADFASLSTVPLGMSIDHVPCKAAWAKDLGIARTRLLADFWPHGGVAKSYGVFSEKSGASKRANIIIDEKGKIAWIKIYPIGQLPDIAEVLKRLRR